MGQSQQHGKQDGAGSLSRMHVIPPPGRRSGIIWPADHPEAAGFWSLRLIAGLAVNHRVHRDDSIRPRLPGSARLLLDGTKGLFEGPEQAVRIRCKGFGASIARQGRAPWCRTG